MKITPRQAAFAATAAAGMWGMWTLFFGWTMAGASVGAVVWFALLVVLMAWAEGGEQS